MIFEESYTLHNGAAIPKLALGTWFIDDDRAAEVRQTGFWQVWDGRICLWKCVSVIWRRRRC